MTFVSGEHLSTDQFSFNSLAPYEKRVIELLRNSKDKRARKLAKKRVRYSPALLRFPTSKQPLLTLALPSCLARYLWSCQEEG